MSKLVDKDQIAACIDAIEKHLLTLPIEKDNVNDILGQIKKFAYHLEIRLLTQKVIYAIDYYFANEPPPALQIYWSNGVIPISYLTRKIPRLAGVKGCKALHIHRELEEGITLGKIGYAPKDWVQTTYGVNCKQVLLYRTDDYSSWRYGVLAGYGGGIDQGQMAN